MNIKEALEEFNFFNEGDYITKNMSIAKDIVLTAYENLKSYNKGTKEALRVAEDLEHQANKEVGDWEARCFELEAELEKEKEKNKELEKQLQSTYQKQYINDLEAINHSNVSFN